MTITVSQISALVGRYKNSVIVEQANSECPMLGKKIIKTLDKSDKVGVVNIKAGELSSAQFIADAGDLPTGDDVQPTQGTYLPVGIFARVSIPRIAAKLATSLEDGIHLVKEQMDSCGKTLGRLLARGIVGSSLGSPAATVNTTSTTFTIADPQGLRVGMAFEIWNGSTAIEGHTQATLLRITNIAHSVDGSGNATVTFTAAGGGGNTVQWLTSYTIHLRGSKTSGAQMISLADVAADASLLGVAQTGNEWSGNLYSPSTAETLSLPLLRNVMTTHIKRRGKKPDYILSSRKNEQRYSDLLINNRRFPQGKMDAVGGLSVDFEGVPWFTDENFGDSDIYYFTQDDVLLHRFQDFEPELDEGKKKGMGTNAHMVSDSKLIYDVQVLGIFNLRPERRNGLTRITNMTS